MVRRIEEQGWKVADAALAAGLSVRRAYHWLGRYRAGGERMLCDRSSTPARYRASVPAERVAEIERLRRQRMTGPQIARQLGHAALDRRRWCCAGSGLGPAEAARPEPPPVIRYQRERPGELIHIDTKKLGRIDGIGHRITGYHVGVNRKRGIGWDVLHVCIDDASRLAYTEILPDEKKESAIAFLDRALAWFARHGVAVERVMTDNGSAYRSHDFRRACAKAGLRHIRTRPYTPRTNGKAERFIQTSPCANGPMPAPTTPPPSGRHAMQPWIADYNHSRPHSALGGIPPATRLNNVLGFDT